MNSDARDADRRIHEMMADRTAVERLRMASRMFATARALVGAGVAGAAASDADLRRLVFLRFYGREFRESELERIIARLA